MIDKTEYLHIKQIGVIISLEKGGINLQHTMFVIQILALIFGYFYCIWRLDKVVRENKQLHERIDILQQQLIEALNKDVKNQDNFSTDPVE